jgi:hypothetical protein
VVALVVTVAIYAIARCGLVAARNVND